MKQEVCKQPRTTEGRQDRYGRRKLPVVGLRNYQVLKPVRFHRRSNNCRKGA